MVIENKVKTLTITTFFLSKKVLRAATSSGMFDMENAFSTMNIHNYTSASSATSGSIFFNSLEDSRDGMIPPTFLLFYNNPYLKDMQAYDAIPSPQAIIALLVVLPLSLVLSLPPMFYSRDFFPPEKISPPKDTETPVKSPISVSPSSSVGSSSVGSSSPVRSTTSPPDYPFDKSIFVELDNSLWIIPRP
ncbi:hypothetical protein Tco_0130008, partial [Tanacetum coccineum]